MTLVLLLAALAVVAVVGVLAAGRTAPPLAPLAEPAPDLPPVRLPEGRPVAAADLEAVRLPVAVRGYRMDVVDGLLDRLAAELADRDARLRELEPAAATQHGQRAQQVPQPPQAPGSGA